MKIQYMIDTDRDVIISCTGEDLENIKHFLTMLDEAVKTSKDLGTGEPVTKDDIEDYSARCLTMCHEGYRDLGRDLQVDYPIEMMKDCSLYILSYMMEDETRNPGRGFREWLGDSGVSEHMFKLAVSSAAAVVFYWKGRCE